MTIKNIVFDLGNVLIEYNPWRIVGKVFDDPDEKALIVSAMFDCQGWKQLDKGVITFDEHQKSLVARLPQYAEEITWLLAHWHESPRVIPGMPELIQKIHAAGYDIYLLSNANSRFYTYAPELDFLNYFKGVTISSDLHLLKPQRKIYDRFCEIHELNPGECLFIDDMQENVEGARRSGWQAYRFTDAPALADYLEKVLSL